MAADGVSIRFFWLRMRVMKFLQPEALIAGHFFPPPRFIIQDLINVLVCQGVAGELAEAEPQFKNPFFS